MKNISHIKQDDQENIEKTFDIIYSQFQKLNLAPPLYASVCASLFVQGYINSGFTYDEFSEVLDEIKEYYKSWWSKIEPPKL